MQKLQNLLRHIFGEIPPVTRCRERDNPFTQLCQNAFAVHWGLPENLAVDLLVKAYQEGFAFAYGRCAEIACGAEENGFQIVL